MKKDVFLHEMKRMRSITFEHRRYLFEYKPTCLTDFETDKKTRFKNIKNVGTYTVKAKLGYEIVGQFSVKIEEL